MNDFTRSSARTSIDVAEAAEIARQARRDDPNAYSRQDVQALLGESALVLDGLRRRPRYFDGRFLTGADLTRDQNYIRQRQADLARAGGIGVVTGLRVGLTGAASGQQLTISAGHGVTPAGDLVLVTSQRKVAPLDIPAVERLDATLGLRREPRLPLGRRTGLFILALRPVEFTANPIAAYPTSINGPRQIEDGDVIEATAITLIPYPDTGGAATLEEARRTVARQVFLGDTQGLPQNALPLAMIAFDRGAVRWIDEAMVRRETGADTPLQVALGASPRAQAEAFVVQHRRHLRDVMRERRAAGLPDGFAAAQYFAALPAAGQLPVAAIQSDQLGFLQLWFPPAVNVDVSFVPSDEVAALVEESLALPPIDLLGDPQDLDATGVVVLAPVTRQRFQKFATALGATEKTAISDPAQGIRRAPAALLAAMEARRTKMIEAQMRDGQAIAEQANADAHIKAWHAAWAEAVAAIPSGEGEPPMLWYVRRRAVASRSQITGVAVMLAGDDEHYSQDIRQYVDQIEETERLTRLTEQATPFAIARIYAALGSPRIRKSALLARALLADLEKRLSALAGTDESNSDSVATRPLTEGDVIDISAHYGSPMLGDGLERIRMSKSVPVLAEPAATKLDRLAQLWLSQTGLVMALDRAALETDRADFPPFLIKVARAIKAKDESGLAQILGLDGDG